MARALRAGAPGLLLAAALLAPAGRAQMASLDGLDREFTQVVADSAKAVVLVAGRFSGVSISDQGHVLTDAGVAQLLAAEPKGDGTVAVTFAGQRERRARLIAADETLGVALLLLDGRGFDWVRPGEPGALEVGHFLLTLGNAFGTAEESEPAATLGIVSSIRRDAQGNAMWIETSAATNPGQHGGPYFNTEGELVGLFRALPDGQDLALVTPVDRLRAAFAGAPGAERAFGRPRAVRSLRSQAHVLSQAFHLAAMRARPWLVTLLVTRAPPAAVEAAGAVDAPGPEGEEKSEQPEPPAIPDRLDPITGTLVDARGFVVAALPPLGDDVMAIEALLHDGRRFRASVVARDRKAELALLLLDLPPDVSVPAAAFPPAPDLAGGQFLIVLGAPHGPPPSPEPFVTVGILAGTNKIDAYREALLTDAGVNVKNMGGLAVDLRGRPVGVVLPPVPRFGQNSGLGLVMPGAALSRTLPRLLAGKDVEPCFLGVRVVPGSGGLQVEDVIEGTAAEAAGLEIGDLLVALDGTPMNEERSLTDFLLREKSPGDTVRMRVRRGGAELDLAAVLGKRPER